MGIWKVFLEHYSFLSRRSQPLDMAVKVSVVFVVLTELKFLAKNPARDLS